MAHFIDSRGALFETERGVGLKNGWTDSDSKSNENHLLLEITALLTQAFTMFCFT
jgi:hypothetical protein